MRVEVNNDYKCVMFIPNINYWYEEGEPKYIFIGWLIWGVCIYFGDTTKVRKNNADIVVLKEDVE